MVDILRKADGLKKSKSGRKNKLNLEEQLLMALEYLREYRTYFQVRTMGLVKVQHIKL
ncbi:IS5 family transposase ISOt6 [Orientia tsutsugamushi]|uniref:IS5 family transposase ISOt6 n=1 Tax=Orientia tsutsugamushi TaxID=784 RepID=A0A2U3RB34_ORITS|nr:IS5 family transposase ISOt6 [Orientia tsutsugamushi]